MILSSPQRIRFQLLDSGYQIDCTAEQAVLLGDQPIATHRSAGRAVMDGGIENIDLRERLNDTCGMRREIHRRRQLIGREFHIRVAINPLAQRAEFAPLSLFGSLRASAAFRRAAVRQQAIDIRLLVIGLVIICVFTPCGQRFFKARELEGLNQIIHHAIVYSGLNGGGMAADAIIITSMAQPLARRSAADRVRYPAACNVQHQIDRHLRVVNHLRRLCRASTRCRSSETGDAPRTGGSARQPSHRRQQLIHLSRFFLYYPGQVNKNWVTRQSSTRRITCRRSS